MLFVSGFAPVLVFASVVFAADRPWYFDIVSSRMVSRIVDLRSSQVPTSAASSMAHLIVEGMLDPPQATQFAQDMANSYIDKDLKPTDYYAIAREASSLYAEARAAPTFDSYLAYVSSHVHNFDVKKLAPAAVGSNTELAEAYHSVDSDPSGHAAIKIARGLVTSVAHDAKLPVPTWVNQVP